jgi:hypothetical protein
MAQIDIEPTPNPNSLKITAAGHSFIPNGMATFSSATEAADHPLGARLFAVEGIANVFILPQFLTVTKQGGADWDDIFPDIERTVAEYLDERD